MSAPPPIVFRAMSFEGTPERPSLAAPFAAAGREVVSRRVLAGVVDLAVGFGLMVLLAAMAGTLDTSHGFNVRLDGLPAFLWIAAVLLFPFVSEALTGRTLGKAMLGLRVVRAGDGGPPGAQAIAIRTLFRVVDGLPLFYGLGALVMFATPYCQRVGDLAAGTVVVRNRP